VTFAEWHPDDERLLGRYVESRLDDTVEQHLAWCQPCAQRAAALTGELDYWHRAASHTADEVFGVDRLDAQRRAIQQKLGAIVPARVLAFPAASAPERHAPLTRVAAAVLLVALAGAGVLRVLQMPKPAPTAVRRGHERAAPLRLVRDSRAEAAALEDIDLALLRPRTAVAELRALDEFTPHVRDIAAPRR